MLGEAEILVIMRCVIRVDHVERVVLVVEIAPHAVGNALRDVKDVQVHARPHVRVVAATNVLHRAAAIVRLVIRMALLAEDVVMDVLVELRGRHVAR